MIRQIFSLVSLFALELKFLSESCSEVRSEYFLFNGTSDASEKEFWEDIIRLLQFIPENKELFLVIQNMFTEKRALHTSYFPMSSIIHSFSATSPKHTGAHTGPLCGNIIPYEQIHHEYIKKKCRSRKTMHKFMHITYKHRQKQESLHSCLISPIWGRWLKAFIILLHQ